MRFSDLKEDTVNFLIKAEQLIKLTALKISKTVEKYFSKFLDFLCSSTKEIIKKFKSVFVGVKAYISRAKILGKRFVEQIEQYLYDNGWKKRVTTQTVSEDEIPPDILAKFKASKDSIDVTNDLEKQVQELVS